MRGRSRGNQERIIALSHQIEMMARKKTLRALKHYLPKPDAPKQAGAMDVLAMMKRMQERQGSDKARG